MRKEVNVLAAIKSLGLPNKNNDTINCITHGCKSYKI